MVILDDVLIASERAALIFEVMSLAAFLILYFGRPVTIFGAVMRAIMPIIAMTIMSSTKVNAFLLVIFKFPLLYSRQRLKHIACLGWLLLLSD